MLTLWYKFIGNEAFKSCLVHLNIESNQWIFVYAIEQWMTI